MNTTPSQSAQAMSDERAACEATFPHLSHATALDEGLAAYRDTKMQGVWEGWQARAAASAQATVHPTPISISTEKICEVAKKYNLGNPRLDALRGFVNEIILVNGAEYAKSE
ncbi:MULTISPECIES: hypothetical protein [unclassified Paraburkholderia]|uniref:hypothetical protein n=1 Tax=unclassified Paraburkholderia TaxID=2615204 RepID=UPI001610B935|nr:MULTISPECIES: hypothetical protein [unclassified Paraburkholderia]MBB5444606.1 hypothetical protein [Paraburkholderia sp. WSM4177]MBB5485430.1 hypothetical protein [Paraburkholderia sp. WSM4180]